MELKKKQYKKIIRKVLKFAQKERSVIKNSLHPEMPGTKYSECYGSIVAYDLIINTIEYELNKAKEDTLA